MRFLLSGHLRRARRCFAALPVLVALTAAEPVPAGAADASVFAAPVTVAAGASEARLAVAPSGEAVVAWAGRGRGVVVQRRAAGASRFGPPELVAASAAYDLRLTRGPAGDLALAWLDGPRPPDGIAPDLTERPPARILVARAAPGARFGAPERPAGLPESSVPPDRPGRESARGLGPGAFTFHHRDIAVGGDGLTVLAYVDGFGRAVTTAARRGGGFEAARPVPLAADDTRPVLASGGTGGVTMAWMGRTPLRDTGWNSVLAATADRSGGFGSARIVSDPRLNADTVNGVTLAAGPGSEAIAAWAGGVTRTQWFPLFTQMARRDAGGRWSAPRALELTGTMGGTPQRERIMSPTAFYNARGDALVTGTALGKQADLYTPSGRDAGPLRSYDLPAPLTRGGGTGTGGALDAVGVAVRLYGGQDRFEIGQRLHALVREVAGTQAWSVPIAGASESTIEPTMAADDTGRAVVAWRTASGLVRVSDYAAPAPALSRLRLGRRAVEVGASRPSAVRVIVRVRRGGKVRERSQRARVRARRKNVIRLDRAMQRLVQSPGRYGVTVRASDGGPRSATIRRSVTRSR